MSSLIALRENSPLNVGIYGGPGERGNGAQGSHGEPWGTCDSRYVLRLTTSHLRFALQGREIQVPIIFDLFDLPGKKSNFFPKLQR